MNAAQRDHAIAIIEDAPFLCRDVLIDTRPGREGTTLARPFTCCGVGELALAAGHTPDELDVPAPTSYVATFPGLAQVFGLTDGLCERLERANDCPETVLSRTEQRAFHLHDDARDGAVYDLSGLRKAAVIATLEAMVPREAPALPNWLALAGDLCRPVHA